jgi:hypothetical protein
VSLAQITRHFGEALVRLVPPYWGKPRIAALLQAYINQVQAIEDAAWQVANLWDIDTADTARLDVLGKIVGQARCWSDDEVYRRVIRARIRAQRSRGLTNDIIEVVRLIVQSGDGEYVRVYHYSPATMAVLPTTEVSDEDVEALAFLLPKARPAGVQMHAFLAPESAGTYDFESTGIDLDNVADPGTVDPGLFDVRIL